MKKIVFASVLALAAASATVAPSQAETVIIKTHRHHCVTKLVTHWRHGHKVTDTVKVCK